MRYGFCADGFAVVDDGARIGHFAYTTSAHWESAKHDPKGTAERMMARTWQHCPDYIRERHYLACCDNLAMI